MALHEVPAAMAVLIKNASREIVSEELEARLQQVGVSTETFDLMEIPPKARSAFLFTLTLLISTIPTEANVAAHCATAYVTALAISQAYEDPSWKERIL